MYACFTVVINFYVVYYIVVLGAELELMGPASAGRIAKLVQAVEQQLSDDGVLGGRGGGDGGLFGGILTRYLALVARRLPGDDRTRATAARLVRNSARAAWRNAIDSSYQRTASSNSATAPGCSRWTKVMR